MSDSARSSLSGAVTENHSRTTFASKLRETIRSCPRVPSRTLGWFLCRRGATARLAWAMALLSASGHSGVVAGGRDTTLLLSIPPVVTHVAVESKEDALERGMSTKETAERLGVSRQTLRRMRRTGQGPAWYKVSIRELRYDRKDLEAWIKTRKAASR